VTEPLPRGPPPAGSLAPAAGTASPIAFIIFSIEPDLALSVMYSSANSQTGS